MPDQCPGAVLRSGQRLSCRSLKPSTAPLCVGCGTAVFAERSNEQRAKDGDAPAKESRGDMRGRVAEVRHQRPRAFGDETVAEARKLIAGGLSLRKAAAQLGVSHATLSDRLRA